MGPKSVIDKLRKKKKNKPTNDNLESKPTVATIVITNPQTTPSFPAVPGPYKVAMTLREGM